MLEIAAASIIVVLVTKELIGTVKGVSGIANLLYLPVLPLLVLFAITAYERIAQLPLITG